MSSTKLIALAPISPEQLPDEYFANVHGKRYILHQGLLRLGHENGPINIDVEIISYAGVGAEAVVTATVAGPRGTFKEVGDADPKNTALRNATLRLASTRAINRALRLYLGVGMTSLEEMPMDIKNENVMEDPYFSGGGSPLDDVPARKPAPKRKTSNKRYGNWDGTTLHEECPDCGGMTWDNRERTNPRAPVFKCRDGDDCGWIVWPAKDAPQGPAASTFQPKDHMTDAEVNEVF